MPSGASDTATDANRCRATRFGPACRPSPGLLGPTPGPPPPVLRAGQPVASGPMDVTDETFQADVLARSATVPGRRRPVGARGAGRARRSARCSRRRWRTPGVRSSWPRSTSTTTRGSPRRSRCSRSRPSSPSATARWSTSSSARCPRRRSTAFVQRLAPAPSEADSWPRRATRRSLRRALELEPDHAGGHRGPGPHAHRPGRGRRGTGRSCSAARDRGRPRAGRRGPPPRGGGRRLGDRRAEIEAKLNELLERVRDDDAARQEFVDLLEAMGADDPRTNEYRRALAARLF